MTNAFSPDHSGAARVVIAQEALNVVDGQRRAARAVQVLVHGVPYAPDFLLNELMDAFEADGQTIAVTSTLRGFMRSLSKCLEGRV